MQTIDPGVPVLEESELEDRIQAEDPVVVLFYADWCGFCRAFVPTFREEVGNADVDAVAANISSESDPRWSTYEVDTVPTLIAFRNGETVARADGRAGRGLEAGDLEALLGEL